MSSRKFFSGLPPNMMKNRNSVGPNRQQTNFYWPDESNIESQQRNRLRNRSISTASIISQSQASTDTEESRRRRNNDMSSRIEFYDMVDTATDTESVYSRKMDPTKHKKLETLKSRIEFYDYVEPKSVQNNSYDDDDTNSVIEVVKHQEVKNNKNDIIDNVNNKSNENIVDDLTHNVNKMSLNHSSKKSQFIDSFSDSEDDEYRYQRSHRREPVERKYRRAPLPQQPLPPPPQPQRPRRYQSHYFDDYDDGYERYHDNTSIRSSRQRLPVRSRRNYSPDYSDEEFYEYDRRRINRNYQAFSPEREFRSNQSRYGNEYESYRDDNRRANNQNKNTNGYGSEMDQKSRTTQQLQRQLSNETESELQQQQSTSVASRPPIRPVSRSMSISESRRRHHVNLKSNIFHNDNEYEQVVEQRKPLSVREFAANHRIGVGLPDLYQ